MRASGVWVTRIVVDCFTNSTIKGPVFPHPATERVFAAAHDHRSVLLGGPPDELLNCFRHDALLLGESLRVLAVDVQPEFSSACHSADASFRAPHCLDEDFIPRLLEICQHENVELLVPTIDTELEVLAAAQDTFAAIGTRVHISSPEVVRIARDKAATARFLTCAGLPAPQTGTVPAILPAPDTWRWPLILKPIAGSSSIGICIARDLEEFQVAARLRADYLAQEYWVGREFTINIFFDQTGKLRCAKSRP